jgi:hypothetical protein
MQPILEGYCFFLESGHKKTNTSNPYQYCQRQEEKAKYQTLPSA